MSEQKPAKAAPVPAITPAAKPIKGMDQALGAELLHTQPVSKSFYRGLEADLQWRNDARWER